MTLPPPKKQLHHKKKTIASKQKRVTDFMLPLRCFVFFFPLGILEQSNLGRELCQLSSLPGERKKTKNKQNQDTQEKARSVLNS